VLRVDWHGISFELLADRAVHWPTARTLLVADPHFGKAASFRASGIPVPIGTGQSNAARLTALINRTAAQRFIILGDLLHDQRWLDDETSDALHTWRDRHPDLEVVLVRGNHDRRAGDPPASLRIRCVDEPYACDGLTLCHDPQAGGDRQPFIAGHVHPAVVLCDPLRHRIRRACFLFDNHRALMPAFGAFTGASVVRPSMDDRVFVPVDDQVIEIPARSHVTDRSGRS
jgi:DNA ligase-associated metallophosphoesterase